MEKHEIICDICGKVIDKNAYNRRWLSNDYFKIVSECGFCYKHICYECYDKFFNKKKNKKQMENKNGF